MPTWYVPGRRKSVQLTNGRQLQVYHIKESGCGRRMKWVWSEIVAHTLTPLALPFSRDPLSTQCITDRILSMLSKYGLHDIIYNNKYKKQLNKL